MTLKDIAIKILKYILEDPLRLIRGVILGLIVPGATLLLLLILGAVLNATGHETIGLFITNIVNHFMAITTKIGMILLKPVLILVIILLFILWIIQNLRGE
jgi:hypothetical protein